jgi:hypothetical protein
MDSVGEDFRISWGRKATKVMNQTQNCHEANLHDDYC